MHLRLSLGKPKIAVDGGHQFKYGVVTKLTGGTGTGARAGRGVEAGIGLEIAILPSPRGHCGH